MTRASHSGSCARTTNGANAQITTTAAQHRVIPRTPSLLSSDGRNGAPQHQPDEPRREDKHRLRDFLGGQQERQGRERDENGGSPWRAESMPSSRPIGRSSTRRTPDSGGPWSGRLPSSGSVGSSVSRPTGTLSWSRSSPTR